MPRGLASKDYKFLLETIELANSISDRAGLMKAVWEKIERWIGITSAAFILFDTTIGNFDPGGHLLFNSPPETMSLFCSHYGPLHPFLYKGFHLNSLNEAVRLSTRNANNGITFSPSLSRLSKYQSDGNPGGI